MENLTVPEDIVWVEGPPMTEGRLNHECGRIRKSNNNTDEYSIIVVGGSDDKQSVEIYDINKNSFQRNFPFYMTNKFIAQSTRNFH